MELKEVYLIKFNMFFKYINCININIQNELYTILNNWNFIIIYHIQ